MRKFVIGCIALFCFVYSARSQYADLGTGSLKNQIWWFNWNNFTISNGASRNFLTADGLNVTITFSNVSGPVCTPNVMETWYGSVLHFLYDFSNTDIKPALHTPYSTQNSQMRMTITATRNGSPVSFKFIAADAEASALSETIELVTTGTPWSAIDFFRNSAQTSNPFLGCNTTTATLTDTWGGGSNGNGQNPVISSDGLSGSMSVDCKFTRSNIEGQSAIAFGIFASMDRGDLPLSYGYAHHNLVYTSVNPCNFLPPLPSLTQSQTLKLGNIAGDPDKVESADDNAIGLDEDAVQSFPNYTNNGSYTLTVNLQNTTGSTAHLAAWFDFNKNGTFESSERQIRTIANNATNATVTWTGLPTSLPIGSVPGYAFRFRLSSNPASIQNPDGFSTDGEIEDYIKNITPTFAQGEFLAPDTVCVDELIQLQNTTQNGSSFYWNFCSGSLNLSPLSNNVTSPFFLQPTFTELVRNGASIHVFLGNQDGSLVRLDFGNSLSNNPIITNLGNFSGQIPSPAGGFEIHKDGNSWIGYIVGGTGGSSRIVKLHFGDDLVDNPTVTNLGNVGSLNNPSDFTLTYDGTNWFGLVSNTFTHSITRLNFGNSLNNSPSPTNLGNVGAMNFPSGIFLTRYNGDYLVFATNRNNNSLSRLNFGPDLNTVPSGINIGNPSNLLINPTDISIINDCSSLFGFVVNKGNNQLIRLDFTDLLAAPVNAVVVPGTAGLNSPNSISRLWRTGSEVHYMVPNTGSNSLTRLSFANCTSSSIVSFHGNTPPPISYSQAGEYNVSLFVDDGLATQNVYCKKIVVLPKATAGFTFSSDVCSPLTISFVTSGHTAGAYWSFGDGQEVSGTTDITHVYNQTGIYNVKYSVANGNCRDTVRHTIDLSLAFENIVLTPDTTICIGMTKQLRSVPSLEICWTPTDFLDDPNSPNPITSTQQNITYYLTSKVTGTNLIANGNFSGGNTSFTSDYDYLPSTGVDPGKYNVGSNITAWHPGMAACSDHTTGSGNMLMVNGAGIAGEIVWSQTIAVNPNSVYAFSAWLQHITSVNPAKLQFSINGTPIGSIFEANNTSCVWEQFYEVWNSGSNTTAVISIINQNLEAFGNDFALDDIEFAPFRIRRDSVIITVEDPEITTVDDLAICSGAPVTLTTTGASSYMWTPATNLSNNTIANPVATPTSTIEYFVTGTSANGCTAMDSVTVTVNANPVYTLTTDSTICNGASLTLLAQGGSNIVWTPNSTLNVIGSGEVEVTPSTLTTYYVTIEGDNDCSALDSVVVNVRPDPVFSINDGGMICEDDTLQLSASGGDVYLWSPPGSIDNNEVSNPNVFPTSTTEYLVQITDTVCNNEITLSTIVTVNPLPEVIASKSNDIDCTYGFAILSATGAQDYQWSPAIGLDNAFIRTPRAIPTTTSEYIVKGTDINGCSNEAQVMIEVSQGNKIEFFMPNAFTPNNDGLNDCYGIKYPGFTEKFEFSIYNRWGERIFYTKDPSTCWNGTYKGVKQDIGVYVYMIRMAGPCNGERFEKGLFTLIR